MSKIIKQINKKFFNGNKSGLKLFDVSLRDGLQSKKQIYTLNEKKDLLHKIIDEYHPKSIELGSIVSKNILPQMNNSIDLYKYAINLEHDIDYYLLVPNKKKLKIALDNDIKNMSFISSFSNSFQKKNINKSLQETINEIREIDNILQENNLINNKLYLSCFNDCPIEKEISEDEILFNIIQYSNLKSFNEICLSDTTGNLKVDDFVKIFYQIRKLININNLSLHLHVKKNNENNIIEIIKEGFKLDLNKLDISCIDEGGCSVTMNKSELNSNLNYNLLNKLLD